MVLLLAWPSFAGPSNQYWLDTLLVMDSNVYQGASDWVTGLLSVFILAAGLGLGAIGLRFVVRMIRAGVRR